MGAEANCPREGTIEIPHEGIKKLFFRYRIGIILVKSTGLGRNDPIMQLQWSVPDCGTVPIGLLTATFFGAALRRCATLSPRGLVRTPSSYCGPRKRWPNSISPAIRK